MRPLAVQLCLLAALAGTPLRQAEAAGDWSRSLPTTDLKAPDGGVGDDSEVGTLTAAHGNFAADALADVVPFFLPPPVAPGLTQLEAESLRQRVWWPQAPPGLRHAWLKIFRF